jgi:hypothetical protein
MESHKNLNYDLPHKPSYIIRLDDVQSPLWSAISTKIIDDTLNRNMSISIAIIPARDSADKSDIVKFIRDRNDNPHLEIMQHGFDHTKYEYANLSTNETQLRTMKGLRLLYRDYDVCPVTFIPPNNMISKDENDTSRILGDMGFRIISSSGDVRYTRSILNAGHNIATKQGEEMTSPEKMINMCKNDFKKQNLSVIMVHPQDFVASDKKTLDPEKYANYIEMLNELNKTGAQSITFRDLLKEGDN